jgi:hypothetical protein
LATASCWHDAGWSYRSTQAVCVESTNVAGVRRSWSRLSTVDPGVVPLAGVALLGERLTTAVLAGAAVLLAGLALLVRPPSRRREALCDRCAPAQATRQSPANQRTYWSRDWSPRNTSRSVDLFPNR